MNKNPFIAWTRHDQEEAIEDGWMIADVFGTPRIWLVENSKFKDKLDATTHIRREALRGNNLHRKALAFLLLEDFEYFLEVMEK
jgi:hypothetical protein